MSVEPFEIKTFYPDGSVDVRMSTTYEIAQRQADLEADRANMINIRIKRDSLLRESDWTQLSDAPLTAEQKASWAEYRQLLRDLPGEFTSQYDVVWPLVPQ